MSLGATGFTGKFDSTTVPTYFAPRNPDYCSEKTFTWKQYPEEEVRFWIFVEERILEVSAGEQTAERDGLQIEIRESVDLTRSLTIELQDKGMLGGSFLTILQDDETQSLHNFFEIREKAGQEEKKPIHQGKQKSSAGGSYGLLPLAGAVVLLAILALGTAHHQGWYPFHTQKA